MIDELLKEDLLKEDHAILDLMASIDTGLKIRGYQGTHFTGFRNPDNGALLMLTSSEDGKHHFAIEVRMIYGRKDRADR